MFTRNLGWGLLAALLLGVGAGCQKSASSEEKAARPAPQAEPPIARVHWLGKQRLSAETNATAFMHLWQQAEALRLEAQTLDKLALAPWLFSGSFQPTNYQWPVTNYAAVLPNCPPAVQLRPLLDDLVQQESYLEIRQPGTNTAGELAFAIRLNEQRAAFWQTNLGAVLAGVAGTNPTAASTGAGWDLPLAPKPGFPLHGHLQLVRAGEWTLLGLAPEKNGLLTELTARIQSGPGSAPFPARATNYWLEADLSLGRISQALGLGWNLPADLPAVSFTAIGDSGGVLSYGELKFSQPLSLTAEPWNIPTNLVHEPLMSFTAVRGIQPWLSGLKAWQDLGIGPPPNQAFVWAQDGMPFLTFVAVPRPQASNEVFDLTERLVREGNAWMTNHVMGQFERATNFNGVVWKSIPFMSPSLESAHSGASDFVLAKLFAAGLTNQPMSPRVLSDILGRTNLVYYEGELTDHRTDTWFQIGQLFRIILHRPQVPTKSAGVAWLKAVSPNLGECVTLVTQTGPEQLSFSRKSVLGLSSAELQLLVDWLESPQFPRGLHTTLAAPAPKVKRTKQP